MTGQKRGWRFAFVALVAPFGLLYVSDLSGFLYCLDAKTGEIVFANMHFDHLFGQPASALGGEGWHRIVHPPDLPAFSQLFQEAFDRDIVISLIPDALSVVVDAMSIDPTAKDAKRVRNCSWSCCSSWPSRGASRCGRSSAATTPSPWNTTTGAGGTSW